MCESGSKHIRTKEPYDLKGNLIETTQGHEVDDGFIEVSKNDELEIIYSNATKTAKLIAFVSKEHISTS